MVTPADCLGQEVTPGTPSVPVHPHLCAPFRLPTAALQGAGMAQLEDLGLWRGPAQLVTRFEGGAGC